MNNHPPTTLMTGATGFLGHFVLRELLARGRRVVAMVRSPLSQSCHRLTHLLRAIGVDAEDHVRRGQLIVKEGALPDNLPDGDWGPTDDILACAASLRLLSNGNGEPYKTNVEGTTTLIEWARRHGVRRIHAVSTAYVCGALRQDVREVFHAEPPGFQTEYERSKWLAERQLAEWAGEPDCVLTILRPSFLVGDSQTGYTTQFGGFYQFARLVSLLKKHAAVDGNGDGTYIPLRIPGHADDPIQNLVPVDFAARMIAEIVISPELHGRIYHLTDPQPPSWGDFKRWLEEYFHIHGGYFVETQTLPADRNQAESLMWEKYELLMPRLHHHIEFVPANTQQVMRERGIQFPRMDRSRLFLLLDYASSQRWGQRSGNGRRSGR